MKKIWLIFVSALLATVLQAQDNQMITGGAYDKETGEPLISASVYFINDQRGTITNAEGEFVIQKSTEPDTLVISYIGYITKKYPVNNLPERIFLEKSAVNLSAVVITPGYVNKLVMQIWEKYNTIYEQVKKNQVKKNIEAAFFYRQTTKTDSIYSEFIECFLSGINIFAVLDLELQQGRYGKLKMDKSFTFTNFFWISQMSFFRPQKAGKNEIVLLLQPDFESIYNIEIEDRIYSKDNDCILVLNFKPKKNNKNTVAGKLYVNETDLSVLRFEGIISSLEINIHKIFKSKKYGYFSFCVNYKDNSILYPIVESVNAKFEMKMDDRKYEVTSMLFMVEQSFEKSSKKLNQKDVLIKAIDKINYNPEFWKNNPVVKRTAIDEEVIRAFESQDAFGTFKPE
jgi:hypothetical protein